MHSFRRWYRLFLTLFALFSGNWATVHAAEPPLKEYRTLEEPTLIGEYALVFLEPSYPTQVPVRILKLATPIKIDDARCEPECDRVTRLGLSYRTGTPEQYRHLLWQKVAITGRLDGKANLSYIEQELWVDSIKGVSPKRVPFPVGSSNVEQTYRNARYGFEIRYPADQIYALPETEQNQRFLVTKYGEMTVSVRATPNGSQQSVKDIFNLFVHKMQSKVTYKQTKDNWLVVAGEYGKGESYYSKRILVQNTIFYLDFWFPTAETAKWAPLIDQIVPTFVAGPGEPRAADALPTFGRGQSYNEVRKKMLKLGWKPAKPASTPTCVELNDDRCKNRPEVESCSGSGAGYCTFLWVKNGRRVSIQTIGELDPPAFYSIHLEKPER